MDESAIRRVVESVLSDSAFRASHGLGGFGPAQRDQLDILTAQMAQLMSDRSLQAAIGNQLWMDGVSIIDGTITAPKIDVVQLSAVAILTGDLTINGTLTLGSGGSIVDADGSVWDQDGMVFRSPASLGDTIDFVNPGQDGIINVASFISSSEATVHFRARNEVSANEHVAYLQLTGDDTIGDTEASLLTTDGGVTGASVRVFGNGDVIIFLTGGGNLRIGNLPTSLPGVTNALWDNAGVVNIT